MQRAQTEGDVVDGLVLTGQVASGIGEIVWVADLVPEMATEAAGILRRLAAGLP